ncbi:hypothetical protein DRW07_07570 [Alteromonas sediminis]|uniref:Uncharacterized protein n=1 Tax=Alteromonas sediminis TaxID=2259342 RepID=A0A3N5YD42_9ALTE|nr:hypothetical protein [Alteromonas sediminis]RPJ67375.1 hypothetical protein DRW07_07570 [Alteromonas sediminis]
MNHSQTEKLVLERQAAEVFARSYSAQFNCDFSFVSHNMPKKPDVTCKLGTEIIDIEIAHLYGSQAEAQHLLGKSLSNKTIEELICLELTSDPTERFVSALNRILLNKSEKTYDSKRVWLVIRNANPNWTRNAVLNNLEKIQVPSQHCFEQVWFITDVNGDDGLIKLY